VAAIARQGNTRNLIDLLFGTTKIGEEEICLLNMHSISRPHLI
jgi:hypothetical protein